MTTLDTSRTSDGEMPILDRLGTVVAPQESRWSTASVQPSVESWFFFTHTSGWNLTCASTVDAELSALVQGDECDLDSVLSRLQIQLTNNPRSRLPMDLVRLVRDESADPDARSIALEALASARIPDIEDEIVAAIAAGLDSKLARVYRVRTGNARNIGRTSSLRDNAPVT